MSATNSQNTIKKIRIKFDIFELNLLTMKKLTFLLAFMLCIFIAKAQKAEQQIDKLMTSWHQAAAKADFNGYFGLLHDKSIYMGTDALPNAGQNQNL